MSTPSSMSPVNVFDVSGAYTSHEGRRALEGEIAPSVPIQTLRPRASGGEGAEGG